MVTDNVVDMQRVKFCMGVERLCAGRRAVGQLSSRLWY
jgi:hypothetical protein